MKKTVKILLISAVGYIPLQVYLIKVWLPDFLTVTNGLRNLDSRFFYRVNDVLILKNSLMDNGIKLYNKGILLDSVYAIFTALLVYSILKLIRGFKNKKAVLIKLTYIIPGIYLVCDWLENLGIILFMNIQDSFIFLTPLFSFFTMTKHSMGILSLIYIQILIVYRIKEK